MTDVKRIDLREQFSDILSCGFEFDHGWNCLVKNMLLDMIDVLEKAGFSRSDLKIRQIKEKFGTLRCYYSAPIDLEPIVDHAEALSAHTCETCGGIGRVQGSGWLYCICERCAREKNHEVVPLVPEQVPEGFMVRFEKKEDAYYRVIVTDPRRPDEPNFMHARAGDVGLAALELMEAMLVEGAGPTHATVQVSPGGGTTIKKSI